MWQSPDESVWALTIYTPYFRPGFISTDFWKSLFSIVSPNPRLLLKHHSKPIAFCNLLHLPPQLLRIMMRYRNPVELRDGAAFWKRHWFYLYTPTEQLLAIPIPLYVIDLVGSFSLGACPRISGNA